jgi:hypothetical protein
MKLLTIAVLVLVVIAAQVGLARAQEQKTLTQTPREFQTFYAKFRGAVLKKDRKAVAALTSFPFEYGWDAGDEGTYTETEFIGKFDDIFGGAKKLFAQKNPKFYFHDDAYDLFNEEDASHYFFRKEGGTYKFISLIVEP